MVEGVVGFEYLDAVVVAVSDNDIVFFVYIYVLRAVEFVVVVVFVVEI